MKMNALKISVLILMAMVLSGCSDASNNIKTSSSKSTSTINIQTYPSTNPSPSYEYPSRATYVAPEYEEEEYDYGENEDDAPLTFYGDECTDDCSGHEAGYDWAEENGIMDPSDCDGNSDSFIEGCESYAEEQQPEDDGIYDGYDEY